MSQREVVVLVGLQGAGKSTFAQQRFAGHVLVSRDRMPKGCDRWSRQQRQIFEALVQGRDVVVDNTHASAVERAPVVAQARAAGARVVGYYVAAPLADCLRRNALREGKARIPEIGVLATASRLERPALREGFDALWFVRLDEVLGFSIEPWSVAS